MNTRKKMNARHDGIIELVKKKGYITTNEMIRRFKVSSNTIRKDLTVLDQAGSVARIRGGASLPQPGDPFRKENSPDKFSDREKKIAKAVSDSIKDYSSLFIGGGESIREIAEQLAECKKGLRIITNNLTAAGILSEKKDFEVIFTGGVVPRNGEGIMGESAMNFISQFKVDVGLISVDGVDRDGSLFTTNYQQSHIPKLIIRNSRSVYLAADHHKLGRPSMVKCGTMTQIDKVITDKEPPADLMGIISDNDIGLIIS